ncbi:ABC transporter permease [Neolewinella lacunae]|uniref:ABC transporter permease n=1 Tax=Neolewinella lacunae TaxID=1517758 RepID=A0A923T982_9BACT|nr:ABC transporter permease [Neolewinella lacunae]MBC6995259.1 ABC transporter permease [Neolewinella lacunae]MDN3635572.1 ABC transporter permease [Neolewinella lacunae]
MSKTRNQLRPFALGWLFFLGSLALLGDFVANDRPLMVRVEGELRFPVLHDYGLALGVVEPYQPVVRNWYRQKTDWAWWPLIPYSAGASDLSNSNYRSPFGAQQTGERARHYLGTDDLGRDVAAGMVAGARVALIVGLGASLLSLLLGIPLGGIAGFFGNDQLRAPRYHWWGWSLGGVAGMLYVVLSIFPFVGSNSWLINAGLVVLGFCGGGLLLRALLRWVPALRRPSNYPADTLVLQGIELFVNIPGLVLLIALLAIIDRPSIWLVVLIIGVLRWPAVARHLRAELLRIRRLPYIEAARVSGIGKWRILLRHALPNALGPVLIVASFGLGSAILLEAFLSFLGIGIPADQVTWGSLLRQSREQPTAWWMAVFPGVFLTLTVLAANVLGEE